MADLLRAQRRSARTRRALLKAGEAATNSGGGPENAEGVPPAGLLAAIEAAADATESIERPFLAERRLLDAIGARLGPGRGPALDYLALLRAKFLCFRDVHADNLDPVTGRPLYPGGNLDADLAFDFDCNLATVLGLSTAPDTFRVWDDMKGVAVWAKPIRKLLLAFATGLTQAWRRGLQRTFSQLRLRMLWEDSHKQRAILAALREAGYGDSNDQAKYKKADDICISAHVLFVLEKLPGCSCIRLPLQILAAGLESLANSECSDGVSDPAAFGAVSAVFGPIIERLVDTLHEWALFCPFDLSAAALHKVLGDVLPVSGNAHCFVRWKPAKVLEAETYAETPPFNKFLPALGYDDGHVWIYTLALVSESPATLPEVSRTGGPPGVYRWVRDRLISCGIYGWFWEDEFHTTYLVTPQGDRAVVSGQVKYLGSSNLFFRTIVCRRLNARVRTWFLDHFAGLVARGKRIAALHFVCRAVLPVITTSGADIEASTKIAWLEGWWLGLLRDAASEGVEARSAFETAMTLFAPLDIVLTGMASTWDEVLDLGIGSCPTAESLLAYLETAFGPGTRRDASLLTFLNDTVVPDMAAQRALFVVPARRPDGVNFSSMFEERLEAAVDVAASMGAYLERNNNASLGANATKTKKKKKTKKQKKRTQRSGRKKKRRADDAATPTAGRAAKLAKR